MRGLAGERMLEFSVEEDWEPLCRFLGKNIPEGVEFPHVDEEWAEFRQRAEG